MFEVYIHEAHPGENNPTYPEFARFKQPKTMEDRIEIFEFYRSYIPSKPLVSGDTIIIPALIDYIDRTWENKYSRLPTAGFVIGFDGNIKENTGFLTRSSQIKNMEEAIEEELASRINHISQKGIREKPSAFFASTDKIIIQGIPGTKTLYSLYTLNGALIKSGRVSKTDKAITLQSSVSPGIYLLKIGMQNRYTIPIALR